MKKVLLKNGKLLLILLLIGTVSVSCSSDDNGTPMVDSTPDPDPTPEPEPEPEPDPVVINFGLSTVSGAFPNQTTYLQGFTDLDFDTIGNEEATELAANGGAGTTAYNEALYASPFGAPANLVKYTFDADGNTVEDQRIVVPGANVFSALYFKSETVAYGTVAGGISKLIVFDPTDMRITGEVDLNTVTSLFPEATRTYYQDMVERDDKLFMSVYYEANFAPVNDNAYIAVIDLATNEVEKVLEDQRTGMLFGGPASSAGIVKVANGDIYIQGKGTLDSGGNADSGILRINNGTTEFDADYFFNLNTATGNICYGIYHLNGKTYTTRVEDETDFWEFQTGEPQFKYYEIDLENQTSLGAVAGLPITYGTRNMIITALNDNELAMSIATNNENALFKVSTTSADDASKMFTSTGGYISGFLNLE